MRILMLTHHPPFPPISGGRVRAYELLLRLAHRHEITLVCFAGLTDDIQESISHLREVCQQVEVVPTRPRNGSTRGLAGRPLAGWPRSTLPFLSYQAYSIIRRLLVREHYDVVHCAGYYIAQNIPKDSGVPVVLAEDNIEYICAWRRFLVAQTPLAKIATLLDFVRERSLEVAVWHSVAAVLVTSELERRVVASYRDNRLAVVPNGVDTHYFDDRIGSRVTSTGSVGMLANFDYQPNLDAVRYFRDKILPRFGGSFAGPIVLIGNSGSEILNEVRTDRRFVLTGRVPDVRPYLGGVNVVICPLRLGGGTKIKVLESLAMRRAVVTTRVGAEGFDLIHGEHLLIADSPSAFADAVCSLLSDPNLSLRLGESGRSYVAANHNWDVAVDVVESVYQQL